MRLRAAVLIVALALAILAAPLAAEAQRAGKAYKIGLLGLTSAAAIATPAFEAFRAGLRELGYAEGRNVVFEYRWAEGKFDRLPSLAAELVERRVDVILVAAVPTAQAAKHATTTIPIVFVAIPDPVALGLVSGLSRPGGNLTGLSNQATVQQAEKELELLKELAPTARRVAVLRDQQHQAEMVAMYRPYVQAAAQATVVTLQVIDLQNPGDLDSAFARMAEGRAEALWVVGSPMIYVVRRRIAELAIAHRLPSVVWFKEFVEAGGLASYGASLPDQWRRAASFVDKILKGAKPGGLPVEQPTKFELVINMKTAKTLGLTIPPSVLIRADEVIQ